MCRILCVRSDEPFDMASHLAAFAQISRESREYQGDGWGCAWIAADGWRVYRDISPVWEDAAAPSGRTTLLLAHARSAYRGEGIRVENNMPFFDGERAFIFNGELHGVRIKERGRIGAEKVFNFIKRFGGGDMGRALERGLDAIEKRTRYVRAMNLIVADASRRVHFATRFSEEPDYFRMHASRGDGVRILCSAPYPDSHPASDGRRAWTPVANGAIGTF
ncbi:MAG: hypothetical protein F4X22_13370 [Gemmatimonadales bacterium]|nr:hypothetical protein [Candidatus Palauibacter denitrificans]